jgi:hypothetical protein
MTLDELRDAMVEARDTAQDDAIAAYSHLAGEVARFLISPPRPEMVVGPYTCTLGVRENDPQEGYSTVYLTMDPPRLGLHHEPYSAVIKTEQISAPTCPFHGDRAQVRNGMCEPCAEKADDAR